MAIRQIITATDGNRIVGEDGGAVLDEAYGYIASDDVPVKTTRWMSDYIAEIQSMVKDSAAKLSTTAGGDLESVLTKAIADYSQAKPFTVRKKVQGNGTSSYSVLSIFGSLWKHGFSSVREIEYPIGYMPKQIVSPDQYELYDDGSAQDGSNIVLRFDGLTLSLTDYFVAEFTLQRQLPSEGDQNFPDTDETFSNITTLASAYACQRLAAAYAQSADAAISADVVNYNDKSAKYQALAKQYMRQYNIAVFGSEDPVASISAAIESKQVDRIDSTGSDYLFHRRRR